MIHSIRARVVFLVLMAQLLAATGAVALAIGYIHRALWSSFDSELQARMVSVLAQVGEADEKPDGLTFDGDQASIPKGDLFYIEDPQGQPLAGSSSWIEAGDRDALGSVKHWKFRRDAAPYRAKALINAPILDQENHQIPQLRVNLFYAIPADRTEAQIGNATRIAIGVGLLSLTFSVGATWQAVGRGMRPLTEFAHRADLIEVDGARFEEPVEAVQSLELAPLARALHRLAGRVQAAFQRERQFLSDAAHELKTTVTIQKSTLQLLEQGRPGEGDYREGIARALEDTARTERLVADMLLLSSIEHAQRTESVGALGPAASLNDTLLLAIDRLTPMARMKSVSVELQPAQVVRVEARESDLNQLWVNLIENAIQHSPDGSRVLVEVDIPSSEDARVRIVDCGPGIPSQDLPHVFERFYRSDSSRSRLTGGFGLGLAIAKAVVVKNHGTIHIHSIQKAGTTVEVTFRAVSK